MVEGCTKTHNSRCECLPGHYLNMEVCSPHKACPRGKGVAQTGTTEKNTKCRKCMRGYFSSKRSSTAPCQKHRDCSLQNLDIIDRGNRFRDNICGDTAEQTHPPVASVLNVTFDTKMSSAVLLSSAPSKLEYLPSTLLQPDQITLKSPDEQLTRAITAIQLSNDHLTTEGSAMGEVVPVATEEGPCDPADEPFYSDDTNLTSIADQSLSKDNTKYSERAPEDDFIQPEPQLVDLPMSSRYYTEKSQNEEDAVNSSKDSILPDFADSVFANITEEPTSLPSLGESEIPAHHETSDQNDENRNMHLDEDELTMQTTKSGQQPLDVMMGTTDKPTQDVEETVTDRGECHMLLTTLLSLLWL
ncbi:uncharacterized protein LOC118431021 [Branchiostoma floridae]|uniref:Uncharacterized protein LOC118431021 n=1 Tax=Branchiostoma floridae TaxID=7739 RepID=A0A9J7NCE5_BRAFL|nr:uncharacterized protein LOC118431021 [Branchiostoma floridae]